MKKPSFRLCVTAAAAFAALAFASSAFAQNYVILYKQNSVASDAAATVKQAGGSVVATYPQIGVVIAKSSSPSFGTAVLKDSRVDSAESTRGFGVQLRDQALTANGPLPGGFPNSPATDSDNLSPLQWDMAQIHAPEAHAITGGSRSVLVGDIDSGMDFEHPDLAPNYDAANSTDCSSGSPAPLPPNNDLLGHGTHTAGTIAAASNGVGIVGVAPNVRIASIKAISPDFFLFPDMIVCAFMWAGTHHMNVTNNSYFADPWLFNCRNDPEQRAIWNAERRAIKFAMGQGVVVVAAAGNESDDLAHPTQDIISPDTGPGEVRRIRNDCAQIPVEIPGVIGVSGTGSLRLKSFYSSYGTGVVQVAAPGGDDVLQVSSAAPNGLVLSTIQPGSFYESVLPAAYKVFDCSVSPCAEYLYLEGTSMATPHVTGLAALVESRYGPLSPGRVASLIAQTADSIACPDPATLALYAPFPSVSNDAPQTCTGGAGYNSWYGHGEVNALSAVTR
jgi:lantibiotic leader peptide-processing serine protease